jgi:hypothetical protein
MISEKSLHRLDQVCCGSPGESSWPKFFGPQKKPAYKMLTLLWMEGLLIQEF